MSQTPLGRDEKSLRHSETMLQNNPRELHDPLCLNVSPLTTIPKHHLPYHFSYALTTEHVAYGVDALMLGLELTVQADLWPLLLADVF